MKTKKILAIVLFSCLLLGWLVFFALLSFSEHREYKKSSIDYWLLTPKEISEIAKFCKDDPNLIYSAADGAKPLVVQLKCMATQSEVVSYLEREGFIKANERSYKKDEKEVELISDADGNVTMATLLVFI